MVRSAMSHVVRDDPALLTIVLVNVLISATMLHTTPSIIPPRVHSLSEMPEIMI